MMLRKVAPNTHNAVSNPVKYDLRAQPFCENWFYCSQILCIWKVWWLLNLDVMWFLVYLNVVMDVQPDVGWSNHILTQLGPAII